VSSKWAPYIWAALLVPIWIALILCTHWEPLIRDSWGHFFWHMHLALTPHNIWDFAYQSYLHNNPRLGQVATMLVSTPGPWHSIITPIVEVLLFVQLTALALGRWPSPRRTDDALVLATIVALIAATAPSLGPMLFYKPFTGNYVFGFVISLAFILPYRFHVEDPRQRGWWWIAIMLVAGIAAGLSNEHTGPTFAAAAAVAAIACWWRGARPPLWMVAGLVGVVAGGLALYVAPGQEVRYNGLGAQEGIVERIASRGFTGDLKIVVTLAGYSWKMVAWLALGLAAWFVGGKEPISRARSRSVLVMALGAIAIAITLLASPKQGQRLYFASLCLFAAALASVVVPMLVDRRARVVAWVFAVAAIGYVLVECVRIYAVVGPEFAHRLDAIEHPPENGVVTVAPYSEPRSRWFLGEDFIVDAERRNIAMGFGLKGILLDAPPAAHAEPSADGI
jgi:uncharacterized protein DUF6056